MSDHWSQPTNVFMTKNKIKLLVIPTLMLGMAAVLVPLAIWTAQANSVRSFAGDNRGFVPSVAGTARPLAAENPATLVRTTAAPVAGDSGLLNARHRFALGMIETANNDDEIGGAGEVSRYQIMPSVWKHYSDSRSYQNPEVSLEVARQHWTALHAFFKQQTHREPTNFDMYVLWNTRYGYYASKGFNPARLNPVVRDRAQRFVNLIERVES
ncbi:MAG TPA: hypothetical protein DCQ92_00970 [Verrucomicrobia subdivision 3 bacterium]|nr:hypothetical protein [Limisphaerales bacterium]